jgi:hypothetical protein
MKMQTAILFGALWLAQICALLLFLFWGAFFLDHLQEWFLRQDGQLPPSSVWLGQLLHLAMLLGLGLTIFRPAWGAMVSVVATVLFFSAIGYKGFPYIALLNLPPVIFAALYTAMRTWARANGLPPATQP